MNERTVSKMNLQPGSNQYEAANPRQPKLSGLSSEYKERIERSRRRVEVLKAQHTHVQTRSALDFLKKGGPLQS